MKILQILAIPAFGILSAVMSLPTTNIENSQTKITIQEHSTKLNQIILRLDDDENNSENQFSLISNIIKKNNKYEKLDKKYFDLRGSNIVSVAEIDREEMCRPNSNNDQNSNFPKNSPQPHPNKKTPIQIRQILTKIIPILLRCRNPISNQIIHILSPGPPRIPQPHHLNRSWS